MLYYFNFEEETFNPRPKCKICVKIIYSMEYYGEI